MKKPPQKQKAVRAPEALWRALDAWAECEGSRRSDLIRRLLTKAVREHAEGKPRAGEHCPRPSLVVLKATRPRATSVGAHQ